jgi:hypothetical protein
VTRHLKGQNIGSRRNCTPLGNGFPKFRLTQDLYIAHKEEFQDHAVCAICRFGKGLAYL